MSDRGMKKRVAYKSLIEQDQFLQSHREKRTKQERPILLDDKIEEINDVLSNYNDKPVELSYYSNGYVYKVSGIIKKIDLPSHLLLIDEFKINLSDIVDAKFID